MPQAQAEAHASALAAVIGEQVVTREVLRAALDPLATKQDLHVLEQRLTDLQRRFEVGQSSLETRLTMRFGTIVVAALGAMTAIARLL